MSWLYSQALVAAYLPEKCSDGEPSAQLNGSPIPQAYLLKDKNDGYLEPFPIWDNVRTFDGTRWRGIVDVISGGFPCQDISSAGKGAGIEGEKSGLWREMRRIISEVRPEYVFVENSGQLVSRGLAVVISDLAEAGYDAAWVIMGASDVGAPHKRDRIWIMGFPRSKRPQGHTQNEKSGAEQERNDANKMRPTTEAGIQLDGWRKVVFSADCDEWGLCPECGQDYSECDCPGPTQDGFCYQYRDGILYGKEDGWWTVEPGVGRVADGVAHRMDRLKAIGNGQVPQCAAEAFKRLMEMSSANSHTEVH